MTDEEREAQRAIIRTIMDDACGVRAPGSGWAGDFKAQDIIMAHLLNEVRNLTDEISSIRKYGVGQDQ